MKIATWNVNSLRVRLPQVLEWLAEHSPDILCVQESKMSDPEFPAADIRRAGYRVVISGQKTYNGVATISREPSEQVLTDLPGLDDPQRRILVTTNGGIRIVNLYVPNGQSVGSEKYAYKLDWLSKVSDFLKQEVVDNQEVVVLGDFNIAPEDRDVHDPKLWHGRILCSDPERAAFRQFCGVGLQDSFRKFSDADSEFSWWDYRASAFKRNQGLRIDHILMSQPLYQRCQAVSIDRRPRHSERPSDHAPVIAELA